MKVICEEEQLPWEVENFNEIIIKVDFEQNSFISEKFDPLIKNLFTFPDGNKLTGQAFNDWESFILNIEGLFEYYDYEIVKESFSKVSKTSHYFYFYAKDKDGMIKVKFMYSLRVSEHDNEYANAVLKADTEIVAQLNKKSKASKQKWKIKDIVVNDSKFSDYDEAYDYIDEYLERCSHN